MRENKELERHERRRVVHCAPIDKKAAAGLELSRAWEPDSEALSGRATQRVSDCVVALRELRLDSNQRSPHSRRGRDGQTPPRPAWARVAGSRYARRGSWGGALYGPEGLRNGALARASTSKLNSSSPDAYNWIVRINQQLTMRSHQIAYLGHVDFVGRGAERRVAPGT